MTWFRFSRILLAGGQTGRAGVQAETAVGRPSQTLGEAVVPQQRSEAGSLSA